MKKNPEFLSFRARTLAWLCLMVLCGGSATAEVLEDRWYTLKLGGGHVGSMHTVTESSEGRISSRMMTNLTMKRGEMEIAIAIGMDWVQTTEGRAISARMSQDMSAMSQIVDWQFTDEGIKVTQGTGPSAITKMQPVPKGKWLTPYSSFRYFIERAKAGDREIVVKTMSPEIGPRLLDNTYTWKGEDEITINGRTISTTIWEMVNSATPGVPSTLWVSKDGVMVVTETSLGGMGKMRMELAEKAATGQEVEAVEVFFKLMIEPDQPIDQPWSAQQAVMRVRPKGGTTLDLPSTGYQSIAGVKDGHTTIVVDLDAPQPATAEEVADKAYLGQSMMIDPKDELILELHQQAVADLPANASRMQRCEAMRSFVHDHITNKDLGTAFASASEVAKTRSGDCSEHGVLLAALLRADGLPARVAHGLVYIPAFGEYEKGVFGWHMWSQALVDGNWVDLDATLPVMYSAGHVTTGTSSLEHGSGAEDMTSIISSLGNLEIDVLKVNYE